jgi:hypothetical protein
MSVQEILLEDLIERVVLNPAERPFARIRKIPWNWLDLSNPARPQRRAPERG